MTWEDNLGLKPDKHNPLLGDFLKENPGEYDFFKQAVIDRFKEEPDLIYNSEKMEARKAVVELFCTLFRQDFNCLDEPEREELFDSQFINGSLKDEAYAMQEKVEAEVNGPLFKYGEHYLLKRKG